MSTATDSYRTARDLLLKLREDPVRAHERFDWPDVGDTFNWAVDWFDAIARGNDQPALVIVEEDGSSVERSFDEMARCSDQVAAWLAGNGVRARRRGRRDARQPGRAVGVDAGDHEARRGDHADHDGRRTR